ncbi:hypothetical protein CYMTET_14259 [Cymbomonas tetramitiformis]|uniref:Right handed beta helix domain-containing protein n=1 Tax=Cymbomonas tetramitiformis TaxID=36881 RepID=A0AAE0GGQ6_9CHLO|nr:hypothetical protein CYMTET_14259 [Cymbomonas tetramitiformis]
MGWFFPGKRAVCKQSGCDCGVQAAGSHGGVAYADVGSTLTITNSTLSDNNAKYGGIAHVYAGSTLIITNSTLSDNNACRWKHSFKGNIGWDGLARDAYINNVTGKGKKVYGNPPFDGGSSYEGVATVDTGSTCIITNSAITGNRASSYGGVAFVYDGSTLIITNSTLSDNSAATGGAVTIEYGFMEVRSSTFSKNRAQEVGGAIAVMRKSSLFLHQDVLFEQNMAGSTGGALYCAMSSLVRFFTLSVLLANSASQGELHPPVDQH